MPYLLKNYRRYDLGTAQLAPTGDPMSSAVLGIGRMVGAGIDAFNKPDADGYRNPSLAAASSVMDGGNVVSAAMTYFGQKKQNQNILSQRFLAQRENDAMQRSRSQAALANDPELATGTVGSQYYAVGGPLSRNYLSRTMQADGGSLTPMNGDAVQVNGPDHEDGGVGLPGQQAEVEGGETMQDNFVFSKRLGFAQEHARLQKAIGRIEDKKVMTPERVNSIKRMNERSENLKLSQEYFKHVLHHFGQPMEQGQ